MTRRTQSGRGRGCDNGLWASTKGVVPTPGCRHVSLRDSGTCREFLVGWAAGPLGLRAPGAGGWELGAFSLVGEAAEPSDAGCCSPNRARSTGAGFEIFELGKTSSSWTLCMPWIHHPVETVDVANVAEEEEGEYVHIIVICEDEWNQHKQSQKHGEDAQAQNINVRYSSI